MGSGYSRRRFIGATATARAAAPFAGAARSDAQAPGNGALRAGARDLGLINGQISARSNRAITPAWPCSIVTTSQCPKTTSNGSVRLTIVAGQTIHNDGVMIGVET